MVKLRQTYKEKKLPIILVLTQDIEEDEEDGFKQLYKSINKIIKEKCEQSLSNSPKSISLIQILSKEKKLGKKLSLLVKDLTF